MNSEIISRLIKIADEFPEKIALSSEHENITYKELISISFYLADWLQQSKKKNIGVHIEYCFNSIYIDLACIIADVRQIALPDLFSNQQLSHILKAAKPDIIISDNVERFSKLGLKFSSCTKMLGLDVLNLASNNNIKSSCSHISTSIFTPANTDKPNWPNY